MKGEQGKNKINIKIVATSQRRKWKLFYFFLLTIKQTYFIITNSQGITGGFIWLFLIFSQNGEAGHGRQAGRRGLTLPSVGFFTLGGHSGDCTVFATQRRKIDNTIHLCTITLLASIVCRFRHFQGQYLKSSAICQ